VRLTGAAYSSPVSRRTVTVAPATACDAARRVATGEVKPGFQTPSLAFGADCILDFDGVTRGDLDT